MLDIVSLVDLVRFVSEGVTVLRELSLEGTACTSSTGSRLSTDFSVLRSLDQAGGLSSESCEYEAMGL